jgi:hypothetical protein
MTKHIDEWFTFARERGAGISRREDIVLVTGRDLARSWANVAFQDKDDRVSFEVKVFGDSHLKVLGVYRAIEARAARYVVSEQIPRATQN